MHIRIITVTLILYSILLASEETSYLQWHPLANLPPALHDSIQPGVAGAFAGMHQGALIIAGGANFPEPVWQSEKQYHKQVYILPAMDAAGREPWNQSFVLDRPVAYGASVNTEWGLLCMGGRDKKKFYDNVFFLSWMKGRLHIIYLPSLPSPSAHGYAAILDRKVYLAGGQSDEGLSHSLHNFWVLDLEQYLPYEFMTDDELKTLAEEKGIKSYAELSPFEIVAALQERDSLISHIGEMEIEGLSQISRELGIRFPLENSRQEAIEEIRKAYWKQLDWQVLPAWPGPERAYNLTIAQHNGRDNCIYVLSGRRLKDKQNPDSYEFLTDIYEFNPSRYRRAADKKDFWRRRADAPVCLMGGGGIALGQSHLAILGGDDGSLADQGQTLKDAHPGFPKAAWLYHTITNTWRFGGPTPVNQVTTPAIGWGDKIILASGEIRPKRRTDKIWQVSLQKRQSEFGWLNFTSLFIYLLVMVGMGFYFWHRNKNTDDFFRGGQRIPWWAAGCSIFATMLSSITYMSVPAMAYAANWEYLLGYPAIFLISVFVIYMVLPFFRRINATSAYEYLEKRFNKTTRLLGSGFFIIFQVARMAIVMYLSALALTAITPFTEFEAIMIMGVLSVIYSTLGGVEAVIWTDTAQTFVLLGGALLILVATLLNIEGGFTAFFSKAASQGKFHMINWDWDLASYTTSAFWVLAIGSIAQNLISYTSDQAVVQRYMTTPNQKLAARSILTNGIMGLFAGLLFFLIGTALYVFYESHPASLDPGFKNDAIMPLFIVSELPAGVAGLIVAGIFAAAQSTISTSMNSTATAAVTDFVKPFAVEKPESFYLSTARYFTVIFGVGGTVIAIFLANADIKSLLEQFFAFIGLFGGSLGGLFLLGMFTERATGGGAVSGAIISAITLYIIQSYTQTHVYLYTFIGISSCFISGYLISLFVGKPKSDIQGLTVFSVRDQ